MNFTVKKQGNLTKLKNLFTYIYIYIYLEKYKTHQ